jgi:hypothetical protein
MNIEFDLKNKDFFPREWAAALWGSAAFSGLFRAFGPTSAQTALRFASLATR